MKVLVTGGAGFIGRHIVSSFQGKADVWVIDSFRTGFPKNLNGLQCQLVNDSILNREAVRKAMQGVDYVFHLAAMVSVPESLEKPQECAEINAAGTLLVLEEAARAKAKRFVFSSSAAVYGDNPVVQQNENMPPNPKSPYATTKLDGEEYCHSFNDAGRISTVVLRYFNVFGPYQNPKSLYAAAVPIFIRRAISQQPMTIHGDGTQTRDFVFVEDVAAANAFFATQSNATGVFNVARGQATTIEHLARTIRSLTQSSSPIEHGDPRAGDIKHSVAAVDRLRQAGFTPKCGLTESLEATIRYFSKTPE